MQAANDGGPKSLGAAGNKHDFIHGEGYDAAPGTGQGHFLVDVPSRLPDPSPAELAVSATLTERIKSAIAQTQGFLPFDAFMTEALFAPGLGYYLNGSRKFGAEGDFVTAPEISPLFGQAVARQCLQAQAYGDTIIEFGGGTGKLAASVLTALAEAGWYAWRTPADPLRILLSNVNFEAGVRPAMSVLAATVVSLLMLLFTRVRKPAIA